VFTWSWLNFFTWRAPTSLGQVEIEFILVPQEDLKVRKVMRYSYQIPRY
jgi:hypothetical protein